MRMRITSPSFVHEGAIPTRHTSDGADVSPELLFEHVPADTRSLALVVDDPDAPDPRAPRTTWVHWIVYDMPPAMAGLPEASTPDSLPTGVHQGLNDWKTSIYRGPSPPIGRHRYFFKLYALDTTIDLYRATKAALEHAMKGHVIEEAVLVGTYEKSKK